VSRHEFFHRRARQQIRLPLLFATAGLLFGQSYTPGPQLQTFLSTVDDSEQPYALYLPKQLDPAKKYPLVISLHSEESNHRLNLLQVFGQANRFVDGARLPLTGTRVFKDVDFVVASPLARGTMGYQGIAEKDVYEVLTDVEKRYPIDPDRVYLTGISMGGGGALWMALTRPDVWAAVAPVCPLPIAGIEDLAPNALNLPIRLFHGDQDPLAPVESSRLWQRRLLDAGVPADYIEYPAVRHNAWDFAYKEESIFDWFARFRRNRSPDRVHFVTDSYRYDSAYWVKLDALTPGLKASVDARQTPSGEVRMETQNLDGFTLTLDHASSLVTIDGTTIRTKPSTVLSFHRQGTRWLAGRANPAGKGPGREGPIAAAVSGRHLYVYGTSDSPSPEELAYRKQMVETAARWSTPRERLQIKLPVKADTAVTEQDIDRSDLILFGTRETNSLVARFANRLPLTLDAGAADYGLLVIADTGKHYALVSSGLPWWTGFDDSGREVRKFAPTTFAELCTFGDYLVFKGSLTHVVAEGRFDRNWKLPPETAAKIAATGTVKVQ
jgi:pimeloyl-ACP methyl ester carboxylesterase